MKPYRLAQKLFANANGYFWLPCPICREPFGGQEWRDVDGLPSTVNDIEDPRIGTGICPDCTRDGFGHPWDFDPRPTAAGRAGAGTEGA